MQGLAGPVALALVGLWVVFLVPQVLRQRQQLLDSCADDRYSRWLRVVAVTSRRTVRRDGLLQGCRARSARVRPAGCWGAGVTAGLLTPGRGQHRVVSSVRPEGETVDRPHAATERRSADAVRQVARIRAGLAAARSRRAAAARRRGLLAALLFVVMAAGWAVVALLTFSWLVGAVPTALLVLVLVAGRVAVVSGTRNDERWRELVADAERQATRVRTGSVRAVAPRTGSGRAVTPLTGEHHRPLRTASGPSRPRADLVTTAVPSGPVGRAVHPSATVTDVFDVIVADRGETSGSVRHASGPTPVAPDRTDAWEPVDVPPPAYTLKPPAPQPPAPTPPAPPRPAADETPTQAVPDEPEPTTSGSIDLDAVLERRRASGL